MPRPIPDAVRLAGGVVAALALSACGGGKAGEGALGSGGASHSSVQATVASSGSGMTVPALQASIVAETKAGEGPALVDLVNGTDGLYLTVQLGRANFLQIGPAEDPEPQLSTTAAVREEVKLGFHPVDDGLGACVFVKPSEVIGPNQLEPGRQYTLKVTGSSPETFVLEIVEEPEPASFVALRGWRKAMVPGTTKLLVDLAEQAAPVDIATLTEWPTEYHLLASAPDPSATVERVRFVLNDGSELTAELPVVLQGAPGFTVVVAGEAIDGALGSAAMK